MSSTIAEFMSEAFSSLQLQQSAGCDHCNMCKKPAGLVMMPVRYAATAPSHAHDVDALMPIDSHPNLGEGVTDKVMQRASYILRCMRQGFFYLYYPGGNAQGQKWEQYQVTYNADFIPLPPDQAPILGPVTPASCKASDDWMMSRCITIPEAETIPQVWVAFSDTWWDETIKGQIESAPAERMQSFSPSAAMSGDSSLPHTASMTEVSTWVSEYRPNAMSNFVTEVADKDDANNTLSLSTLFNFENYSGDTDQLIDTVQAASGTHHLIFATHDPRGITMELNQEAIMAVAASQQHYDWRISSFAGIQSIKSAVMQRELSSIRRSVEDAFEDQYWFHFRNLEQARTPEEKESINKQLAADWESWRERALSPGRLEREANDEWSSTRNGHDLLFGEDVNEYLKFTDEELKANYQSHVADPLKQDADAIHVPISEDHATWLTSESLAQCFIKDYRTDQLESGIDYVADFIECLQDGIDRFECANIVKDWAESADVDDPHNLLMRAMGHNQTSHLAALKLAMPGTLEGIVKIMDSFKKIWDQSVKAMAVVESEGQAAASAAFTRLAYYTGAPVVKLLTASTQKAIKPIYMLATMLSTDYVVIPKITSGTAAQYLDVLGEQIRAMAPAHQKPSKTQVRRFLRRTVKQHGYGTQRFNMPNFIALHKSQIRAAAEASSGGYDVIRKMLESGDDLVLDARKIDEIWGRKFTQIANSGFIGSAIGALFGGAGALMAYKALDDADVFESDEMKWRFIGAVAAMLGGLLEATEKGINALAQMGKLTTSGRLATSASRIGRAGRLLGAIGAFIFAVWDTVNAYKEAMVGNFGMALLYGASAFVGAGIVVAVALAFYVSAFFLVVISIILGIIIAFVADSEMQKWLSHCFYGVSERYPDIETSQQQLQEALK